MADQEGAEGFEERTEEPTQHKRDELKKDGQVSQSRELSGALMILSAIGALYATARWSAKGLLNLFEDLLSDMSRMVQADWSPAYVVALAGHLMKSLVYILGPILGATMFMVLLSSVAQTGFVWTTKPLEPELDRLSPLAGLKKIMSAEALFEMFKAFVKFAVIGTIAYSVLRKSIGEASTIWGMESQALAVFFARNIFHILLVVAFSMLLMAIVDYGFQKFRFEQKIRMTKQEAKEERREQEGNPQIKARIRGIQRQMATRKMMDDVKRADVVITNPTHIAIAIIYDRENMFAPKIVAKGADHMAERIKKIAREAGVPCVENVPLARAMYKALKIGQFISRDLYNAVAEVLAHVYRLKGRNL